MSGLQILVKACAWKHVVDLSSKIMNDLPQVDVCVSGISLLMKYRWEGQFRLKMFDELTQEVGKVLSLEQARLDANRIDISSSTTSSSFLPQETVILLQLLLAEVKIMTGRGDEALIELYDVKSALQQKLCDSQLAPVGDGAIRSWLWRTRAAITNVLIRQRVWRHAVAELDDMCADIGTAIDECRKTGQEIGAVLAEALIVTYCRLSRTLMHVGLQ